MDVIPDVVNAEDSLIGVPLPKIKVVGLGGGGCNAVNRMIEYGMKGSLATQINKH